MRQKGFHNTSLTQFTPRATKFIHQRPPCQTHTHTPPTLSNVLPPPYLCDVVSSHVDSLSQLLITRRLLRWLQPPRQLVHKPILLSALDLQHKQHTVMHVGTNQIDLFQKSIPATIWRGTYSSRTPSETPRGLVACRKGPGRRQAGVRRTGKNYY